MPYRTWSRVVQLNYAELPAPFAYSRQHICKLTSSVPISTSSYSFSKSSIPWFKYKSGNHGTQQYAISYLVTSRPTQLRCTTSPICILTKTHLQIDILRTHLNIELQLFQVVDSVVQIQERKSPKHSNLSYRNCDISAPNHQHIIVT